MDKKTKREEYRIRIGPLLKGLLEKQKIKINEVCYDCVNSSEWEAGEILAKKVLASKLI
jgi:hypothetical protein